MSCPDIPTQGSASSQIRLGTGAKDRCLGRHPRRRYVLPALLLGVLITPMLQGCAPAVIAGAAVGAGAIHDRRPYYVVIDDQDIELSAMKVLSDNAAVRNGSRIATTSYNRKALLTGQADSPELVAEAGDLVSRLQKVELVINEVTVGPAASVKRQAEDGLITSRAKIALTDIDLPHFDPTRVKVVTEEGVVYLMGLVSRQEADAATEKVRYVPGVTRVVQLFEITDA